MSKKVWIALAIVVLIGGTLLSIPFLVNVNVYRGVIESKLSVALNRNVTLNDLRLSLFPVAIESKDVRISDDPSFRRDDFVQIQSFRLHLNFWPLLQRQIQVTSLELIAPNIWLVKNSRGVWNISTIGKSKTSVRSVTLAAFDSAAPADISSFNISNLSIKNGRVVLQDLGHPTESQSYDVLEFSAQNISADTPFPFALTVTGSDRKEPLHLEGKAGPLDLNEFANSSCQGTVSADSFHFGKLSVKKMRGQFTVAQQTLKIEPLDFDMYSGHQGGSLAWHFDQSTPGWALNSQLKKIEANQLLSSFGSAKDLVYGSVNGNLNVRSSGQKEEEMLRKAAGRASLELQKGKLAHLSIGQEISAIAQLTGFNFPQGETPITRMSGDFEIANNWARTNNLQIVIPDITLLCQGGFSFDNEMKWDVQATFSKEASRKMNSGSPVGGLLNALLADRNKEVVIPFQVTGTFQKPHFKLDSQRLLKMKTQQVATPSNLENTIQSIQDLFKKKKN